LESIDLLDTRVADLSPLSGMPIKSIDLSRTPVLDFSPLAQLPLEKCYLQHNRITDLAVFHGKPLKELCLWGCEHARNYAILAEIKTLEILQLPSSYRNLPATDYEAIGSLRDHPRLRQLGAEIMNLMGYAGTGSKDIFWQEWDREETFFSALRAKGITFTFRRLHNGAYVLDFFDQPLHDLSILQGMPVEELDVHRCPFVDLTPLRGLKLKKLSLSSDSVTDFTPLRGMPLERLYLNNCSSLRDLSPLTESPLRELYLDNCKNLIDVSALADIPTLEKVTVPVHARNVEALRKLPKLKRLGFQLFNGVPDSSVDDFWKDYGPINRLLDAGLRPQGLRRLNNGRWSLDFGGADISDLNPLQGTPIEILGLGNTKVTDLAALRGMPIRSLQLWGTPIVDLEPLRGTPLTDLNLARTQVSDLSPLEGMPLLRLNLAYTKVADISMLRGMPLIEARFSNCTSLTDVSPLADCKELQAVTLPPNAKDFEFLRAFPKLQRLSFAEDANNGYRPDKTTAEFWQEYDAKKTD
jgi:Leucine-rich repeat (LRR) protein